MLKSLLSSSFLLCVCVCVHQQSTQYYTASSQTKRKVIHCKNISISICHSNFGDTFEYLYQMLVNTEWGGSDDSDSDNNSSSNSNGRISNLTDTHTHTQSIGTAHTCHIRFDPIVISLIFFALILISFDIHFLLSSLSLIKLRLCIRSFFESDMAAAHTQFVHSPNKWSTPEFPKLVPEKSISFRFLTIYWVFHRERTEKLEEELLSAQQTKFRLILIPLYLSFVWCRSDQCDLTTCLHKSVSGNVYALGFNTQYVQMREQEGERESITAYFKLNCHQDYVYTANGADGCILCTVDECMMVNSFELIQVDSQLPQSANAFAILSFLRLPFFCGHFAWHESVWVVMEILNSFISPFIYLRC